MAPQSRLETVPVEVLNGVLSYLVFPRSRLAGLTERLSSFDAPLAEKKAAKDAYFLDSTVPPDTGRFAENLLMWPHIHHPLQALTLTSTRLHRLVEDFCAHLVRTSNTFNLPFAQAQEEGPGSVYPSLSNVVYRRLWLQWAPRYCIFCNRHLSSYPHRSLRNPGPLMTCGDCFYAQTLTLYEIEAHFHLSRGDLLQHNISTNTWCLRTQIEALAREIYGTRKWHYTGSGTFEGPSKQCQICVRAGTLQRAACHWPSCEPATGWTTDPSGWVTRPNSPTNIIRSDLENRWPILGQYRFDENLYENRQGLDESEYTSYIGHHLFYGRLTRQGLQRYE